MRNSVKVICCLVCLSFVLCAAVQAAAPVVYRNVTVKLAGVRPIDNTVSANLTGSFGSKWIEIDLNEAYAKPLLAVLLTSIATEKPVTIFAAQDDVDADVFIVRWMNIEQ